MTDEERKKLVAELREDAPDWTTSGQRVRMLCDEIERLAAALRQAQCKSKSQMTDEEYIAFRRRIADEQSTEFIAND